MFLTRQIAGSTFALDAPWGRIRFRPEDWGLALATEPFDAPVPLKRLEPIVIRNPDEILPRDEALRALGVSGDKPVCLFAFNGKPGEFERVKAIYAYLEDEGWELAYTTNFEGGLFPLADYLAAADLVVCAAGYNQYWETRWLGAETVYVPQPRKNEDQSLRVGECADYDMRGNGADELAERIRAFLDDAR